MSIEVRVLLFVGALLTMLYFVFQIRKNRLQINYTISWSIFSGALLIVSIFPGIAVTISSLLNIESPANLVYLVVLFILILKLFTTTMKLSKMDRKITEITQYIAIQEMLAQSAQTQKIDNIQ